MLPETEDRMRQLRQLDAAWRPEFRNATPTYGMTRRVEHRIIQCHATGMDVLLFLFLLFCIATVAQWWSSGGCFPQVGLQPSSGGSIPSRRISLELP